MAARAVRWPVIVNLCRNLLYFFTKGALLLNDPEQQGPSRLISRHLASDSRVLPWIVSPMGGAFAHKPSGWPENSLVASQV